MFLVSFSSIHWIFLSVQMISGEFCQQFLLNIGQFRSVQSLRWIWLFANSWTAACQASLSITNSRSLPKLMPIESVMPSNHLILSSPSPPTFNFSQHQGLFKWVSSSHQRWPKDWSFSFSISLSNEHPGLIYSGWIGSISLQSKGLSRVFSNTTVQKHQFFGAQLSL